MNSPTVPMIRGLEALEDISRSQAYSSALAAAQTVKGIVIRTPEEAAAVVDVAQIIATGVRLIESQRSTVEGPLQKILTAIRSRARDLVSPLVEGKTACELAQRTWLLELRRRAAEQQEREAKEIQAATDAAVTEAQAAGAPIPPPPSDPIVEAERRVYGGEAMAYLRRTLRATIVKPTEAPISWCALSKEGLEEIAAAQKNRKVSVPDTATDENTGVYYRGCVIYWDVTAVNRRR